MIYSFNIFGHKNILSTHKNTVEFTKERELTKNGDCIVGVKADFELSKLKQFLKFEKVKITIKVDDVSDTITAVPNKDFASNHELVIRLSDFSSERTFAIRADKAADDLNKKLVTALKDGKKAVVTVSEV
ncbi:hypothetical protein CMO88_02610 [Candidatus Woesearchaeota archaeon]|nr:hypothetical protein [Candidatus Woesearchaeota archaeon]|tara:strand:- start:6539 stop:6928 length:390 start_codon:yes stop_codon:yes gene_type:complete